MPPATLFPSSEAPAKKTGDRRQATFGISMFLACFYAELSLPFPCQNIRDGDWASCPDPVELPYRNVGWFIVAYDINQGFWFHFGCS